MGATLLFLGGNWNEAENFVPPQVPTNEDYVITDPSTKDMFCDIYSTCKGLKLTDFTGDIHYAIVTNSVRLIGIIRNHNKYDIFINRPDIERLD